MILISNMQFLNELPLVKCTRILAMANLVYQSNMRRQFDIYPENKKNNGEKTD